MADFELIVVRIERRDGFAADTLVVTEPQLGESPADVAARLARYLVDDGGDGERYGVWPHTFLVIPWHGRWTTGEAIPSGQAVAR